MSEFKTLVLYRTKHGSTKRYAGWIGDALNADVADANESGWEKELQNYDLIIYGGNLNAEGINGLGKIRSKMAAFPGKKIIYFAVGSFPPSEETVKELTDANFPENVRAGITLFHFRGRLDYLGLNFFDKFMMRGVQQRIQKKKEHLRTATENEILMAFEQEMDWCDKTTIDPLVAHVKSFMTEDQLSAMEEKAALRMRKTAEREEKEALEWAEELKRREVLYHEKKAREKEDMLRRRLTKKQRAEYDAKQAAKAAAAKEAAEIAQSNGNPTEDTKEKPSAIGAYGDDYSDFYDDDEERP